MFLSTAFVLGVWGRVLAPTTREETGYESDGFVGRLRDLTDVDTFGNPTPTEPVLSDGINAPSFYFDVTSDLNTRKTLANIGGLLAQCMWESGGEDPFSACDENNYTGSDTASCTQRGDEVPYASLTGPGACEVDSEMTMTAESWASWTVGPMKCEPGTLTEGCCWWGRGAIQTTGPFNYGQLQANVISKMDGFESVDLCANPEAFCQNDDLKFTGALYYWTSVVQQDACFTSALDGYAAAFNNDAVPDTDCAKFSSGIGGSINNGNWNQEANEEEKRQANFVDVMNALEEALSDYDGKDASFACTDDAKIDRVLEISDMKSTTNMELRGVYTWDGFCTSLRAFLTTSPTRMELRAPIRVE